MKNKSTERPIKKKGDFIWDYDKNIWFNQKTKWFYDDKLQRYTQDPEVILDI